MKTLFSKIIILFSFVSTLGYAAGDYVNIDDFLKQKDLSSFYEARHLLIKGFNQVAGDTFREGKFSNLTSLDFACSVKNADGMLKECIWVFSGSLLKMDSQSGEMAIADQIITSCKINVLGIYWLDFVNQIKKASAISIAEHTDLIDMTLSGKPKSIYEELESCLDF